MPRYRQRTQRSGRPVRPMDWGQATISATLTDVGKVCAYALLPSEVRDMFTDPTLMAHRVYHRVEYIVPGSANAFYVGCGLIDWDDIDDAGPAPADCPGPLSNGNLDWINRIIEPIPFSFGTGTRSFTQGQVFDNVHLNKAKRRLGNDKGLLVVFEIEPGPGGFTPGGFTSWATDWRFLIKE